MLAEKKFQKNTKVYYEKALGFLRVFFKMPKNAFEPGDFHCSHKNAQNAFEPEKQGLAHGR